ncbi:DUF3800 domain-containing protein [Candidatus Magnetominusculus xianensis]|uniref:DUF3800 domain-containing protein n=1 Tax=Candidatus Magnetominusculus xianensis TaxID=1748249 RepID=A0ABR5SFM2_9BACT|nr:DUF3800 domain-containing protein [Candidatus Magnetominusculus xianensis]KWT86745.1 hypothetical protein ASN18_1468 [Candidatus Magnetominusculus xianensis]MBF0402536.1 DUF3800 domain-containing protein [Nitrospirota bacterium]
MIYFIDESGTDDDSSRMVLAAIAISEDKLWDFIVEIISHKKDILGMTTLNEWEPKGNNLLKPKKFKLAKQ